MQPSTQGTHTFHLHHFSNKKRSSLPQLSPSAARDMTHAQPGFQHTDEEIKFYSSVFFAQLASQFLAPQTSWVSLLFCSQPAVLWSTGYLQHPCCRLQERQLCLLHSKTMFILLGAWWLRLGNNRSAKNSGVAVLAKYGVAFSERKLLLGSGSDQELLDQPRLLRVGGTDQQLRREVNSK